MEYHRVEAHVFADEVLELFRTYLAETFESGDFGRGRAIYGSNTLVVGIAICRFLLVPHSEQRRLKNVYVAGLDKLRIEPKEECAIK